MFTKKILNTKRILTNEYAWINDLTEEMDKCFVKEIQVKRKNEWAYKKLYTTYLVNADNIIISDNGNRGIPIRVPGATRGHIKLDENNVIVGYKLYDNSYKQDDETEYCYKKSVIKAIKGFVGYIIYIDD